MTEDKDCNYCTHLYWNDVPPEKRVPREFWVPIDHSMSGPMELKNKHESHAIHLREVCTDASFEEYKKKKVNKIDYESIGHDLCLLNLPEAMAALSVILMGRKISSPDYEISLMKLRSFLDSTLFKINRS